MRLCWISTLLLGLFHSALLPPSHGLEGEKKIGIDDVYKPRKWSQVRDGPYRMVVSSRDQESEETQVDSRGETTGLQQDQGEQAKEDEDSKSNTTLSTVTDEKKDDTISSNPQPRSRQESRPTSRTPKEAEEVPNKSRGADRRIKHKSKVEQVEFVDPHYENYDKNEKSTQRAITKLARKRERILSNENFRSPHKVSVPEGYVSTPNPSTISYKLYNHFRPVDRGIPRESIIPFYDFGKKLSTGKTPTAINSIEGSSTPGSGVYGITTQREDEDLFHEDMDVSVVKLKAVERNTVPRVRPPLKNSEFTSFFRTSTANDKESEEDIIHTTTPLLELSTKDLVTTTQSSLSTPPSTEPFITVPTTMLPPEQSDLQTNESKAKTNVIPTRRPTSTESPRPLEDTPLSKDEISENLKELPASQLNTTMSTQVPRPSPTAKILSTAVVTSVSVKETYRHPRIKANINSPQEEIPIKLRNSSHLESYQVNPSSSLNSTQNVTDPLNTVPSNQTNRVDKSVDMASVPSTHRPVHFNNRTSAFFKNNSTIQPTTIRPKFRSNIEYHTFATKVPSTTTTHKPVNRSLYSTYQREHQKHKLISSQHYKPENNTRANISTTNSDNSSAKVEIKNLQIANETKTKMYLTIRSRLPNQSATYRSTFRRNGTKPIPPVLRVIATPSSYIEVPKIISRLTQNSSLTESSTESPKNTTEPDAKNGSISYPEPYDTNTDVPAIPTVDVISPKIIPKSQSAPALPDSAREVRMNNHRMPSPDVTTEEEAVEELTTVVVLHPLETTTTEVIEDVVPTQTTKQRLNETIKSPTLSTKPNSSKPGLSWVYLGQKNRSRVADSAAVEVAYSSGFGIAAYVLAVLGVIPLILGGFVLLRQILIKSKKKMLDESEYSSEYNRTPLPAKLPRIPSHVNWEGEKASSSLNPVQPSSGQSGSQHQTTQQQASTQHQTTQHQPSQHQTIQHQPQAGNWEFPRDKLRLQTLLGEGNFGQVWKAEADDISGHEGLTRLVAVKTVKEGSGGREREDLLRELAIMKELGSHPNVVTLLGCCTDREPFLLIMEYVMYGKMLTFLREHRTRAHYFNFSDLSSALVSRDLTVFAYCVARGMEFLVSKGIIHRDLAARNILVDHNKLCKIADFGMSRNVRDTGEIYEQRPNRGALPIRWMAPEALHCSVFTHKSDVWSFGILVWEIITLGCTPYQTMGAREVMRRVREGYRLDRPVHCSQELYKVITRCWSADSSKRPTFTDLKHDLATLLSDPQTNGACVDLDALTEEMSSHSC